MSDVAPGGAAGGPAADTTAARTHAANGMAGAEAASSGGAPPGDDVTIDTAAERRRIRARQALSAAGGGIDARDLTVVYRNGNVALDGATFRVPEATICALVGINGSGKSTLFKALMGFVPLARGSVTLLGGEASAKPQSWAICARLSSVRAKRSPARSCRTTPAARSTSWASTVPTGRRS